MTLSMTGFARAEADTEFGVLAWEARTVNHRHFDLSLRLPEEFRPLESTVRDAVSARVRRGKCDLALYLRRSASAAATELDEARVDEVAALIERISERIECDEPDPLDLLRWPGVLREADRDLEPLHAQALELLTRALDDLVAGRAREGARIEAVLREQVAQVTRLVAAVRARLPEVRNRIREKLVARIAELGGSPDPARLEQELVMLAQRADVIEELDRLDAHVEELNAALDRDEPIGRRLDFLMQEFNREANTLASKSQDADTTRDAVELKVVIEQLREQVQNLE